jgi:hypothetical protein
VGWICGASISRRTDGAEFDTAREEFSATDLQLHISASPAAPSASRGEAHLLAHDEPLLRRSP